MQYRGTENEKIVSESKRERERENENINDEGGVLRYVRRERELEDCDKILGERNNNYRLNLGISIL